jgi:hypothetical protein
MPKLKELASGINDTAENGAVLVDAVNNLLTNAKTQLTDLSKNLTALQESDILNTMQNVTGRNSEQLGAFLACPLPLRRKRFTALIITALQWRRFTARWQSGLALCSWLPL